MATGGLKNRQPIEQEKEKEERNSALKRQVKEIRSRNQGNQSKIHCSAAVDKY
jgi:hypothetical protein